METLKDFFQKMKEETSKTIIDRLFEERCDEIACNVHKDAEYIICCNKSKECHDKILSKNKNLYNLLDKYEDIDNQIGGISNRIYYQNGFADALSIFFESLNETKE